MRIKADWQTWLHTYKKREVDKAFFACPEGGFDLGLELGAGDGFQSGLLSRYIRRLVSTEINELRLSKQNRRGVSYRICSAEEAVRCAEDRSFDIVYSSNLLEHLRDPVLVLRQIHRIMKDDGVAIHIVPAPLWKLCHLLLYVPANLAVVGERVFRAHRTGDGFKEARFFLGQLVEGLREGANTLTKLTDREEALTGNNPGVTGRRRAFAARLLLPRPHGVSGTNLAELSALMKRRIIGMFKDTGFECGAVLKGPAASGYGLGWSWAEAAFEKAGFASEYIYIAHKKGHPCRYLSFFTGVGADSKPAPEKTDIQ
jgi:SAM-dependent methyltransferase